MLKTMKFLTLWATTLFAFATPTAATAATIGFVENFDTGVEGWEDNTNTPLTFVATGGADGGGYASSSFNYFNFANPFGGPVTFRGSFSDNASGGAFVGDYLTEGVGEIRVSFRHNAPESINLYLRVATQFNFPGAVIAQELNVPSNTWTELVFAIDPLSPACTGETVPCAVALAGVQNLQFGTDVPPGLLDDDVSYSLDLDQITLVPVPEPGTALLFGLGLAGLSRAGRRPHKNG